MALRLVFGRKKNIWNLFDYEKKKQLPKIWFNIWYGLKSLNFCNFNQWTFITFSKLLARTKKDARCKSDLHQDQSTIILILQMGITAVVLAISVSVLCVSAKNPHNPRQLEKQSCTSLPEEPPIIMQDKDAQP